MPEGVDEPVARSVGLQDPGLRAPALPRPRWAPPAREATQRLKQSLDGLGAAGMLVVLVLLLAALNPAFGTVRNLMQILLESAPIGIVAAGMTFVIIAAGIDLSVGSMVGLTGVVAALLMRDGLGPLPVVNPYLAIVAAVLLGTLVGALHGVLISRLRMPAFVLTLGGLSLYKGIALVLTDASPVHQLPDDFKWVANAFVGPVPMAAIIMLVVYLVLAFVLNNTTFGRYTYAIGDNETAARVTGVAVNRWKILIYALSGLMSAVAGVILIARLDGGIFTNGQGYELTVIAGVVIGGTSLMGGTGSMWGTAAGVLIITTVRNALTIYSVPPEWTNVVTGALIIGAVLIDVLRKRTRQSYE